MIFGKHINVYYRKYALALLTGLLALFTVDYLQLKVPEIYQLVINGLNQGYIVENGVQVPFDMAFLSKADICKILPDISPTTVEAVLGTMVRTGSIRKIGSSRAIRYIKA